MFQRAPEKVDNYEHALVRIWSEEHLAYWRRGVDGRSAGGGYTNRKTEAGMVPLPEAYALTRHCGPEKEIWFEFVSYRDAKAAGEPPAQRPKAFEEVRAERDFEIADFVEGYALMIERPELPLDPNGLQYSPETRGPLAVALRGLAASIRAGLVE
jgi:hypothetical protein